MQAPCAYHLEIIRLLKVLKPWYPSWNPVLLSPNGRGGIEIQCTEMGTEKKPRALRPFSQHYTMLIIGILTILATLTLHELKIRHRQKLQSETVLVMQGGGSLGAYECGVF